jgi:hypothetical protein
MSKVTVMDSTYENCSEAVEQAFEMFPVDARGKKVAVKVNALKAGRVYVWDFLMQLIFEFGSIPGSRIHSSQNHPFACS